MDVANGRGVNFGKLDPIGQRQRLGKDLRAAEHDDVRRIGDAQRFIQRSGPLGTFDLPLRIAGDHDVAAAGENAGQRIESLAAHHQRLAHGQRLESAEIGRDVPRHRAISADHAVVSHGHHQHDFRAVH